VTQYFTEKNIFLFFRLFLSGFKFNLQRNLTMKYNNLFIVFEGIDGSGKSTQTKLFVDRLKTQGHQVYHTFEPTDQRIGKIIRDAFVGKEILDHSVIAGLFVADRLWHITDEKKGLLTMLQNKKNVICDRYYMSSFAYQGAHLPLEWVMQANSLARKILKPDITFYIDISPEDALKRIDSSRSGRELFETQKNLSLVHNCYEKVIELLKNEENVVRIDGNQSIDEIAEEVWQYFSHFQNK
jgi:dTMP kinase